MEIKYSEHYKVFYTKSSYGERHLPKAAGFFWNGKLWMTSDVELIGPVLKYCTPEAVAAYKLLRAERDKGIAASMAVDADIDIPVPEGLSYRGYQRAGVAFASQRPATLIGDEMGLGKSCPLTEPILTPEGWKTMGDIRVGSMVIGSKGTPVKVLGVYPQVSREVWAVTFSDGVVVRCSPDHLWTVRDYNRKLRGQGWKTVSIKDLCKSPLRYKNGASKWEIPDFPGHLSEAAAHLSPWLLGQIIGNGTCGQLEVYSRGSLAITTDLRDRDVQERLETLGASRRTDRVGCSVHGLTLRNFPGLADWIISHGLAVKSKEKRLPGECLIWHWSERRELLRGLMDSDGSCHRNRTIFHTCSPGLAKDVAQLVRSLGGAAVVRQYDRTVEGKPMEWQVNVKTSFNPFFSARKGKTWELDLRFRGNRIESVERVADEDCQCILVDSPDHLYVTTGYKLTHNTIQAVALLNLMPELKKVLIACPLAVKSNWGRELRRFLVSNRSIEEVESGKAYLTASIVIVHFNQMSRLRARLRNISWDAVIVDEAHTLRNQTQMTKALFGDKGEGAVRGRLKTIHLSGTPAVNYPVELFPLLNHLDPVNYPWSKQRKFKAEYGDPESSGYRDRVISFQEHLRKTLLVRRLKKDVLTELPPKIRQVIEIPVELNQDLRELNKQAIRIYEAKKEFLAQARAKHKGDIESSTYDIPDETVRYDITMLSRVRHMNALAKISHALEYIEEALKAGSKIAVFAHHQDVLRALHQHFLSRSVLYVGGMSPKEKDAATQGFQTRDQIRLFFGSIYAAGTGITLTAGSHCILIELDWVPGVMDQVEDRLHRMGQRDSVLVQHLVFPGSLDMRMAEVLLLKQGGLQALTNYELIEEQETDALFERDVERERKVAAAEALIKAGKKPVIPMAPHHTPEVLSAYAQALEQLIGIGGLGHDTKFSRNLYVQRQRWSAKQAVCVERIIRKYSDRLEPELRARAGVLEVVHDQ
jgi:hypothetical protein